MLDRAARAPQAVAQIQTISAPSGGWVQNRNLRDPAANQAIVLDNFFPTAQGAELRPGCASVGYIGGAIKSLMPFPVSGATTIVAATDNSLFALTNPFVTTASNFESYSDGTGFTDGAYFFTPPTSTTARVAGLSSGDWSHVQFANSAGQFLYMVNPRDGAYTYDGASFTARSLTGASDLDAVWVFGKRLFFTEQNSLSAWYLSTNAISGALTEFPLQGVFSRGGRILFGTTWSIDSGAGLDDTCIFVTDQGEVAVYTGTDPATDFILQGVYQIAQPLGKSAWYRAGGDVAILTADGIIAVSSALQHDRAALSQSAITFPIEDAWQEAVKDFTETMNVGFWRNDRKLVIGGISKAANPVCYVANSQTGAWCQFKGWDVSASCESDGRFFFGGSDGVVYEAGIGGTDAGKDVEAYYLPRFDMFGTPQKKRATRAQFVGRASASVQVKLFANADYQTSLPASLSSTVTTAGNSWGGSTWGGTVWGGNAANTPLNVWQSVSSLGYSLSVGLAMKSSVTEAWSFEIAGIDVVYETGRVV